MGDGEGSTREAHQAGRRTMNSVNEASSPYSLRDHSKMPSRYRDYVNTDEPLDGKPSPSKSKRVRRGNSPAKRAAAPASGASSHTVLRMDDDTESNSSGNTKRVAYIKLHSQPTPSHPPTSSHESSQEKTRHEISTHLPARRIARGRPAQADLTDSLKENLRRLKNVLKLPKARRWVYCEFFYSGVDQQLFLGDNEFTQLLRESFPNLRCTMLRRPEWRAIRRLIGKPRRCSQAFLNEERAALELKRAKIRQIYEGSVVTLPPDAMDLPLRLPRPLVVGAKIYARVRQPKDGIYAGTIDAVLPDSYRVVFDKEEMIPPMIIKDSEVMSEQKEELLTLTYFLEQNRAAMPSSLMKLGPNVQHFISAPRLGGETSLIRGDPLMTAPQRISAGRRLPISIRDEKVGNFPVRMLVILVKLAKLIEIKRTMVRQLAELNAEAEKMNLLSSTYPYAFQEKYAQLVVDMETLNKQMQSYLSGVNEYNTQLLPQLTEVPLTVRPEALRKLCQTHSVQIVKHCNNGLNVRSKHVLDLITSLTALLLQVRSLGQQRCTALDLSTLSESIADIRKQIFPSNAAAFQDYVEVHMKHVHNMMLNSGAF
ncbi:Protein lin-9 [Toxocara canis]|uniref:Protein lin-9 n=1 Tax=Toxocara canis TaxID=6265 RepID=A0A0B2W683_TOXCA|nr:Protein lin-9 [Toxocara canis]